MLTLVQEDGTGKADANSYASAADGDAYHEGHLYASAWTAATTVKKEQALVMATRLIDAQFIFAGKRRSDTQALQWPRVDCPDPDSATEVLAGALISTGGLVPNDVVPRPVLNATCEFARGLLVADLTKDPVGEGLNSFRMEGAFTMAFRPGFLPPMLPRVVRDFLGRLGQPVQSGGASLKLTRT